MLAGAPVGLLLALALALLLPLLRWPLTTLRIALSAALVASATALARGWSLWLPALLAAPFGPGDPITGLDLSFTVLQLPALQLVLSVVMGQLLVGLAACLWLSVSQGNSFSEWYFSGLSKAQQRVLQPQLAVFFRSCASPPGRRPDAPPAQRRVAAGAAAAIGLHRPIDSPSGIANCTSGAAVHGATAGTAAGAHLSGAHDQSHPRCLWLRSSATGNLGATPRG